MMARIPAVAANCKANMETPPVPNRRTVSPGRNAAVSKIAFQAVKAAQGRQAASSSERSGTLGRTPWAFSTTYSASTPSRAPPRALAIAAGVHPPSSQSWKNVVVTAMPGWTVVTPGPTASTTPAPSEFGIRGSGNPRDSGSRIVERSR